jgi:two-component system, cell cycle sensor histidine kinase and response regulator CckA
MAADRRGGAGDSKSVSEGGNTPLDRIPTPELVCRLASGVAHELNNLLTVIAGRCALAAERVAPDQPIRRDLELIRESAARGVDLAEQLRAFARRQRLDLRPVDLNELLRDMGGPLARLLGDRIDLIIEARAAPAAAEVDPGLLGQALGYLASVARDGMPDGGRLTVATAGPVAGGRGVDPESGRWLRVAVSDTGPPLDDAVRDRLFEPFVSLTGRNRGPGLRLAATLGIVQQLGGQIELESAAGGRTAFAIYLRAVEATTPPRPEPAVDAAAVVRRPGSVIVVDDESHIRDFAVRVLRGAGYRVLEAMNGAHALQLIEQGDEAVHLVVTDLVMPEMSGQELARRLAATHRRVKVLFISGFLSDLRALRSFADIESRFLAKPFSAETLTREVQTLLGP